MAGLMWKVCLSRDALVKIWHHYCRLSGVLMALMLIGTIAYQVKSHYGYNIMPHGGWHTFKQCLLVSIDKNSLNEAE